MKEKIERIILIVIGTILASYVALVTAWASFNWGCRFLLVIAIAMILLGIFLRFIKQRVNWLRIAFYCCVGLMAGFIIFLACYGSINNAEYDEDYCVILGAKVNGYNPSVQLKNRLDAGLLYFEKNNKITFIVTGGQGADEVISEASVMKSYLMEHGVPEGQIITEDKSTSTFENFKFALEKIEKDTEKLKFVYITNDFHVFRAGLIGRDAGITENLRHFKAKSPPFFMMTDYSREVLANAKHFVFGK